MAGGCVLAVIKQQIQSSTDIQIMTYFLKLTQSIRKLISHFLIIDY